VTFTLFLIVALLNRIHKLLTFENDMYKQTMITWKPLHVVR